MYFINHTWFEPQRALIVIFNYVYNLNGFFSCCVNGEKWLVFLHYAAFGTSLEHQTVLNYLTVSLKFACLSFGEY